MKTSLSLIAGIFFTSQALAVPSETAVLDHYADLAHAMYEDSLSTAKRLRSAVNNLTANPTEKNMELARTAWVQSRAPYQQTEAYRFGNAIVDDWEGKVNAWPLDEGLIDYVDSSYYGEESDENPYFTANIIANESVKLSGRAINASTINKELLAETLHEIDEIESNVATGYHAIEFLLWGQDRNGTGAGAGNRPASDYDVNNCKVGNCQRRADYLIAVTDLLVDELEWITAQWAPGGAARAELSKDGTRQGLATIFTGMGSLAYGELAGERMKLGVMLHDPEEEHDCFSDKTHWSHYYDAMSVRNVYTGSYLRTNGDRVTGPSVADLVAARDSAVDRELRKNLKAALDKMWVLVDSAEEKGIAYDQLIAEDNPAGNEKVMAAVDALLDLTKSIEKGVSVLELEPIAFEGSDSLDAPEKVAH